MVSKAKDSSFPLVNGLYCVGGFEDPTMRGSSVMNM